MEREKHIYEFFFLAGVFGAVYLYAFHFDDFSETELVRVSYLWIAALVFGAHGVIATEVKALMDAGQATTYQEGLTARGKQENRSFLSRLATVFLPSYLGIMALFKIKQPFLVALTAATGWIFALFLFLEGIFPAM
ncbi:MAG TPA: hypothetical protein VKP65_04735 [Rhodothermales bacterium]|nr:hypothetical protein [Rhodothermales bacterium]